MEIRGFAFHSQKINRLKNFVPDARCLGQRGHLSHRKRPSILTNLSLSPFLQ